MKIKNVLSLFDGMSVGRYSLEKAGVEFNNYYTSEIDKYAMEVAQKNFPTSIQLGDILKLDIEKLKTMEIDLIIGGSPCQGFSFAGSRKGAVTKENIEITTLEQYKELKEQGFEFQGQSYLFWEYMILLKELKPKYFLLENVRMSDKWEKVLTTAIGVEPILINSSLLSAQNRKRFYWTNIPNVTQPAEKGLVIKDILQPLEEVDKVYYLTENQKQYPKWLDGKYGEKRRIEMVKGSNEKARTLSASMYKGQITSYIIDNLTLRKLTCIECERLQTLPDGYTEGVSNSQRYKMIGNGWTADVIIHILRNLQ